MRVAAAKKNAKNTAFYMAVQQVLPGMKFKSYRLHYFFKDKRNRDEDNFVAMAKATLDGIAKAVKQDDSEWSFKGVEFAIDKEKPRLEVVFE